MIFHENAGRNGDWMNIVVLITVLITRLMLEMLCNILKIKIKLKLQKNMNISQRIVFIFSGFRFQERFHLSLLTIIGSYLYLNKSSILPRKIFLNLSCK